MPVLPSATRNHAQPTSHAQSTRQSSQDKTRQVQASRRSGSSDKARQDRSARRRVVPSTEAQKQWECGVQPPARPPIKRQTYHHHPTHPPRVPCRGGRHPTGRRPSPPPPDEAPKPPPAPPPPPKRLPKPGKPNPPPGSRRPIRTGARTVVADRRAVQRPPARRAGAPARSSGIPVTNAMVRGVGVAGKRRQCRGSRWTSGEA